MRETRWRVVEADGRAYPPNSDPLRSYEVAERRLAYYTKMTRAGGDDARLPKLPLSLEWCQVEAGPWNGVRGGLDLVSPPDPPIPPAASPDERLREALAFYADKGNYTAQNPVGSGAHVWRDMGGRARSALAAADREKPETDT